MERCEYPCSLNVTTEDLFRRVVLAMAMNG